MGIAAIKVINGAKHSIDSNAFVAGWGTFQKGHKVKVYLYDTLIAQHPINEVVAAVNRELGHVVHGHII